MVNERNKCAREKHSTTEKRDEIHSLRYRYVKEKGNGSIRSHVDSRNRRTDVTRRITSTREAPENERESTRARVSKERNDGEGRGLSQPDPTIDAHHRAWVR